MPADLIHPPHPHTQAGAKRRVGVEIEFAGVEVDQAATLVQRLYGGRTKRHDEHRVQVQGTRFGDFVVELDSMYAHPDTDGTLLSKLKGKMKDRVTGTVGDVIGLWMPNEIIAPPIAYDELPELDRLIGLLRQSGGEGTGASVFYGFGLQLNPEVPSQEVESLLRHLQAYLILSPRLREAIDIDLTRRILPFADPFPNDYVQTVLAPGYRPTLEGLVRDYVQANPSRNRELDLMPLFMELVPEVIAELTDDPHIKARPTFHYRLPNAKIDDPAWGGIVEEWNRWVEVERLAADPVRLADAGTVTLERLEREGGSGWLDRLRSRIG